MFCEITKPGTKVGNFTKEIQEKLKVEALRRMKALQLHDGGFNTCVGDFRKNGTPWKSEFHGILYWLDDEESQAVKKFLHFFLHIFIVFYPNDF